MINPDIINEAYNELNEDITEVVAKDTVEEKKRDPKIERIKKLVNDISGLLYKLEDNPYDVEFGKEDDDIRDEMKKTISKTIVKMVDRLKDIVSGEAKDGKKEEEKEDKEEDKKDKEDDDKEEDDKEDDKKDKEEDKEDDKEENDEDDEDKKTEQKGPEMLKLFPTESVISPQGKKYIIIEMNDDKSLLKDSDGENFKIDTDILRNWKNN